MKRKASLALCSIALVSITTILHAQQQDPDLLLQRVRDRLLADLENLVRHTCVQTITRTYRRSSAQRSIPMPCPEVFARAPARRRAAGSVARSLAPGWPLPGARFWPRSQFGGGKIADPWITAPTRTAILARHAGATPGSGRTVCWANV